MIDSIKIQWPDDREQVLKNIKVNQQLVALQEDAEKPTHNLRAGNATLFSSINEELPMQFKHAESAFFDFGSQRAVPQKYSQQGPAIATGDVNGDGLADFFVGGAAYQSVKLFIQNKTGKFDSRDLVKGLKNAEDLGAVFFDSDGDKDLDLVITGGSPEFGVNTLYNQPRLYTNDGRGNFARDPDALPNTISDITKSVAVADFDLDGDLDLFIGGRLLPQKYPSSPRSYILQNEHGRFIDVTKQVCPGLEFPGLIADALFSDFNNDKKPDLVLCGEWMPVRFFVNEKGRFREITANTGLKNMNGQWRSVQAADLDNDGDIDFVAGNLGLNNKFHIAPDRPLKLFVGDFDANNFTDLVPAYYIKDNEGKYDLFPALDRAQLADQVPSVKKKFLLHLDYARTSMTQLLDYIHAKDLVEKECGLAASVWIENLSNGQFKAHLLPMEAQFAPVNAIIADDLDGDGLKDLLLAGNEYQAEVVSGQYDASYGLFLKADGKGQFKPLTPVQSGFILDGDIKAMTKVSVKKKAMIVAAVNNAPIKCFSVN
jgi:hypothetical protein